MNPENGNAQIDTPAVDPAVQEQIDEAKTGSAESEIDEVAAMWKAKFEAEQKKTKSAETALTQVRTENRTLKKAQMTEQELIAEKQREAEEKNKNLARQLSAIGVERVFTKGGLAENDWKDLIDLMVTDDAEKSAQLAQSFVDLLGVRVKAARDSEREKMTKEMPVPPIGGASNPPDLFELGFNS